MRWRRKTTARVVGLLAMLAGLWLTSCAAGPSVQSYDVPTGAFVTVGTGRTVTVDADNVVGAAVLTVEADGYSPAEICPLLDRSGPYLVGCPGDSIDGGDSPPLVARTDRGRLAVRSPVPVRFVLFAPDGTNGSPVSSWRANVQVGG